MPITVVPGGAPAAARVARSGAQVEPVPESVRALGRRRGRDLDVTARASLDQGALDTRHDGQVLAAAHQRQRAGSRLHGPTVSEPTVLLDELVHLAELRVAGIS